VLSEKRSIDFAVKTAPDVPVRLYAGAVPIFCSGLTLLGNTEIITVSTLTVTDEYL
jgi:hypothetical protein